MAATAMIDRLIHHSEILCLKGDSYRLRGKDLDARPGRARRLTLKTQTKRTPPDRRAAGISLRSPTARYAKRRLAPNPQVA